jgi:hypothetical protein
MKVTILIIMLLFSTAVRAYDADRPMFVHAPDPDTGVMTTTVQPNDKMTELDRATLPSRRLCRDENDRYALWTVCHHSNDMREAQYAAD